MLTNREIAIAIWVGVIMGIAARNSGVRDSFRVLLRSFFVWRILAVVVGYGAFVAGIIWIAHGNGLWRDSFLKDTIVWFFLSGFPLIFSMTVVGKDPRQFLRMARDLIGFSAFFAFFVNLSSLPLLGELALQPTLVLFIAMRTYMGNDIKYKLSKRVVDVLLIVLAVGMATFTVRDLSNRRKDIDFGELGLTLAMSFWLPLASFVFLLVLAYVGGYELAFTHLRIAKPRKFIPSFKAKVAIIVGLNIHLSEVYAFGGAYAVRVSEAQSWSEALGFVRAFRSSQKTQRSRKL